MSHGHSAELSDFLAGMFEGASDGLCLVAPDDSIVRANERWLASTGLRADQVIGADIIALFPETRDLARERFARARAGERVAVPRHRQVILGQASWWDGAIAPVRMEGGVGLLITARELPPPPDVPAADGPLRRARELDLARRINEIELVVRMDGALVEVNDRAVEAYGYAREELLALRITDLRTDARPLVSGQMAEALEKGIRFEAHHRRKDGSTFPVEVSSRAIEVGGERLLHSLVRDLTAQRRAQAALVESEQRFRTMADTVPAHIAEFDAPGRVAWLSRSWLEFTGQTQAEARGDGWRRCVHPEDLARLEAAARDAAARGERAVEFVYRLRRADGTYRQFRGHSRFSPGAAGGPMTALHTAFDVTEELAARAQAAASEAKLARALEASAAGFYDLDLTTGESTRSDGIARLLGREPATLAPTMAGILAVIHEDDARVLREETLAAQGDGRLAVDREVRARHADGSWRWLRVRGRRSGGEAGAPAHYSGTVTDATERHLAQEALAESEARFRTLANTAPVLIWVAGTDQRCIWFNAPWLAFTGRTLEQEHGNGWAEGVHPDDLDRCLQTYVAAFDRRVPFQMDYRLRRHDGAWRWITDHGVPRHGPGGEFQGYIGSCIDITEQREARERAEALAREQEVMLETGAVGISKLVERRQVWVNQRVADLLGYPREELIGRTTRALYPSADAYEALGRDAYPALATGAVFQTEQELVRKDGTHIWVKYSGMAIEPRDLSQGTIWFIEDVTARREAARALAESERRLASVIEGSHDGYWDWHVPSGRVAFSARWASMLGYRLEEIAPDLTSWSRLVHPDDVPAVEAALNPHLEGKTERYECEHRLRRKDGGWTWVLDRGQVVERAADGTPIRAAGTHTDVTARHEAEAAVRAASAANAKLAAELQASLDQVRTLKGLLPICMHCHKIRDDQGYWARIEQYVTERTDATFSHGLCPDCLRTHYPER